MMGKELSTIENDLELDWINHYTDKLSKNDYNPVIRDDIITLSVSCKETVENINNIMFTTFNIVLNETKEAVGCISFDYYSNQKDRFTVGNVTYMVAKQFQNRGYATRALKLLVKLLKNNNFKGNKDLYFWVSYYNEFSKKVILNNEGSIISGGDEETKSPYILKIKI